MKEVIAWNPPISQVENWIKDAGNTIGSVWFHKRSNGDLRKMSYRLHVKNPSIAPKPKGMKEVCIDCGHKRGTCDIGPFVTIPDKKRQQTDKNNDQVTVLDANKVVRNKGGEIIGRGAYRCVPLDLVVRIKNKGTTYVIERT